MSTANATRMTAQEYLKLGEDPPGIRRELVDGEIVVSPSSVPNHSRADRKLSFILMGHVEAHLLGELYGDVDNRLSKFTVRRPDIFYFSAARMHLVTPAAVKGPPDLCVEIISPSSVRTDRVDKLREYAAYGVANYWIIDPTKRTAEAYVLADGSYTLTASGKNDETVHFPPFPDLAIPLVKLWWPGK